MPGTPAGRERALVGDQTWAVFLLELQRGASGHRFRFGAGRLEAAAGSQGRCRDHVAAQVAEVADDRRRRSSRGTRSPARPRRRCRTRLARCSSPDGNETAEFAIVASGPNGASPHHEAGGRTIGPGDPIVVDFGGKRHGYTSDTTRMYHVDEPSARYLEIHGIVLAAQQAAVAAVRPGVSAEAVDAAARNVIESAGYGEFFIHRTGHGIGLDTHEDPYIVTGNTGLLRSGMAFSIEPGIYLPGEFGVRIEDIVVCTPDGAHRLNNSSRAVAVVE